MANVPHPQVVPAGYRPVTSLSSASPANYRPVNNTIIHFIETRLQHNWYNNKNADGLVNRLASNLVILNQAHRVAWLIV